MERPHEAEVPVRPEAGAAPRPTALEAEAQAIFDEVAADLERTPPHIPGATYRLQQNRDFKFAHTRELLDYFASLGVTDLYLSPSFAARPESQHGYDIVDHNALNPAIGSRVDFNALTDALKARGMGVLLDIVPNHMGIGAGYNAWWNDVLENGPSSRYAPYFDVLWRPLKRSLENTVLLPFLGDHYGRVLERGELKLVYDAKAGFSVAYFDLRWPLNPRSYTAILTGMLSDMIEAHGGSDEDDHVLELESIITGLEHLPPRTETRWHKVVERNREKEILKRRLATLVAECPEAPVALAKTLARRNGTPGDPRSFDALDEILELQAYRLSYWRVAAEEINYRRFFDINDLAAIRMENPAVFRAAHRLVFELLGEGRVASLRVDHPDGLWDPQGYFADLQRGYFVELCRRKHAARGGTTDWERLAPVLSERFAALQRDAPPGDARTRVLTVYAEKILVGDEMLRDWPLAGTSGYEFASLVGGLFVDGAAERAMTSLYQGVTGERLPFQRIEYLSKKKILDTSLASEFHVLARRLDELAQSSRLWRDFTLGTLTQAVREVIACFPVYRTYIDERAPRVEGNDRAVIERALRLARRRSPTIDPSVYDFVHAVLTQELPADATAAQRRAAREWAMRFQQLTGPVMAKGVEDTAFYVYNRLVSLNEVGGSPARFGVEPAAFHAAMQQRQQHWPHALSTTTTHDTKRSEDVRARISVLSEVPDEWAATVEALAGAAAPLCSDLDGEPAPDANDQYLFWQTLVGTWPDETTPDYVERLVAYMHKATKEAKVNTSWTNSNEDYDAAIERFVRGALTDEAVRRILGPLARLCKVHGRWSSLGQVLLKATAPGVPDVYQGQELWDDSLVDPDNRRPVDWRRRRALLDELDRRRALVDEAGRRALARELVAEANHPLMGGRIKLWVTEEALLFRAARAELFRRGAYVPLAASGAHARSLLAFARRHGSSEAVTVVPRLTVALGRGAPPVGTRWVDTSFAVEGRRYKDAFTGALHDARDGHALDAAAVLADFPVALLERID